MCIILKITGPKQISLSELYDCADFNPDGIGMMMSGHVLKNLSVEEVYYSLEYTSEDNPAIVHFRFASVGPAVDDLIHPFPAGKYGYLFHNGTVKSWQDLLFRNIDLADLPDEKYWSDSKALALLVEKFGSNFLNILASDSRFALVKDNNIQLFGDWVYHKNGLVSSTDLPGNWSKFAKYGVIKNVK